MRKHAAEGATSSSAGNGKKGLQRRTAFCEQPPYGHAIHGLYGQVLLHGNVRGHACSFPQLIGVYHNAQSAKRAGYPRGSCVRRE